MAAASSDGARAASGPIAAAPAEAALLVASLEVVSRREGEVVERFYELFFARHPEVRELFGEHAVSEREEMVRETFVSVLGHAEGAPWLEGNLVAMGRSHAEYGVQGSSYPGFVRAMLDTLEAVAPEVWTPGTRSAWVHALDRITGVMRRAGEVHRVG